MKKLLAFSVAGAIIVGTAYYWWVFPLAFMGLVGWCVFDINRPRKKRAKMYVDERGIIDENSYS